RRVVVVGLATLAVLALLGVLALRAPNGLPLVSYKTLYVSVPDPGNLQPHSDVRIAGVHVGQVIGVQGAHGRALIELKLGSGTRSLPSDTRALVRAEGLLGARYVQLIPGRSRTTLSQGATIIAGPRSLTYGVPDALNTFDAQTRGSLSEMLNGLGIGLLARGAELNDALGIGPITAQNFTADTAALLARPGAARRLAPSLESAAAAFDAARLEVVASLRPTGQGLAPLIAQRVAFNATLQQLPPTLAQARPGLDQGQVLLTAARSLALAADRTLPAAPDALAATTVLLQRSHQPLQRANALLRDAIPTVPAALRITGALSPVLTPLRQTLSYLQPIVSTLGVHGCDVYNMTSNWRSALGYGVRGSQGAMLPSGSIGQLNFFRVALIAGANSIQGLASPTAPLAQRNVYPAPCSYAPGPAYVNPLPALGGH
ncbi:MAG: MlaD family protein, partial [Solirubrobacteraceae bacterium]